MELDERLFTTPSIALEQCRGVAADMAHTAVSALKDSLALLDRYSAELAASIREKEEKTDHYEDALGTYLVKLSTKQISAGDHAEAAKLLKMIGDLERISDHAVNLVESATICATSSRSLVAGRGRANADSPAQGGRSPAHRGPD